MRLDKYTEIVSGRHPQKGLLEAALGLASESGEVAQIMRKSRYETQGINHGELALELGDVMHYLALACDCLEISMEELAELNAVKMQARDKGERRAFEALVALWRWPDESMDQLIGEAKALLEEAGR